VAFGLRAICQSKPEADTPINRFAAMQQACGKQSRSLDYCYFSSGNLGNVYAKYMLSLPLVIF
jgi:hypothetical protein